MLQLGENQTDEYLMSEENDKLCTGIWRSAVPVFCHQSLELCALCLLTGIVIGIVLGKIFASYQSSESSKQKTRKEKLRPNEYGEIELTDDAAPGEFGDKRERWRQAKLSRRGTIFTESMLYRRGSLFANSIRKFSGLTGAKHGLVEARGKDLQIVSIDSAMRQLLVS